MKNLKKDSREVLLLNNDIDRDKGNLYRPNWNQHQLSKIIFQKHPHKRLGYYLRVQRELTIIWKSSRTELYVIIPYQIVTPFTNTLLSQSYTLVIDVTVTTSLPVSNCFCHAVWGGGKYFTSWEPILSAENFRCDKRHSKQAGAELSQAQDS